MDAPAQRRYPSSPPSASTSNCGARVYPLMMRNFTLVSDSVRHAYRSVFPEDERGRIMLPPPVAKPGPEAAPAPKPRMQVNPSPYVYVPPVDPPDTHWAPPVPAASPDGYWAPSAESIDAYYAAPSSSTESADAYWARSRESLPAPSDYWERSHESLLRSGESLEDAPFYDDGARGYDPREYEPEYEVEPTQEHGPEQDQEHGHEQEQYGDEEPYEERDTSESQTTPPPNGADSNESSSQNGSSRRAYQTTSKSETEILTKLYAKYEFPSAQQYRKIAVKFNLDEKRVRKWFQNRRRRIRDLGGFVGNSRLGRPAKGSVRASKSRPPS